MANIAFTLILAAVAVSLTAIPSTTAQSPSPAPAIYMGGPEAAPGPYFPTAPSPGPDCFTILLGASDCLTFVDPASNLTRPDTGCCPEISNIIDTQPICLCKLIGDPSSLGLTIDVDRAMKLPAVCNVTTPPLSLCALIGVPVPSSPSAAPSAGGGDGSVAASPSPGSSDNASPAHLASNQILLIGLAVGLFAYLF